MWADVLNTLGMTKTSKKHVRKKVSKVVVVVERALILRSGKQPPAWDSQKKIPAWLLSDRPLSAVALCTSLRLANPQQKVPEISHDKIQMFQKYYPC